MLSLDLGLNVGANIDKWECEELNNEDWHCFDVDNNFFDQDIEDINYANIVIAAKGTFPLSARNSLYAKLGAQLYSYELESDVRPIQEDDGIGLYFSAGWQYQWDNGLGMHLGYEAYDMGDLETFTLNTGLNYRF